MGETVFTVLLKHIDQIEDGSGRFRTQALLDVCREILPVVDKLGTGFTPVRMDVNGNIERLNTRYESSTQEYEFLDAMIEKEVQANEHTSNSSCTKGLLWLKRAMQFVVGLMDKMQQDPMCSVAQAASDAYTEVLSPFHGWITSGIFKVALNVVPSREALFTKLALDTGADTLEADMGRFVSDFGGVLSKIHDYMVSKGLNFPDKV